MPRRQQANRSERCQRIGQQRAACERLAERGRERDRLLAARPLQRAGEQRRRGDDDRAGALAVRDRGEVLSLDANLDLDLVAAETVLGAAGRRGVDEPAAPPRPLRVLEERGPVRQRTSGRRSNTVLGVPSRTTFTAKRQIPGIATLSGTRWWPTSRGVARCITTPCSMPIMS